MNGGELEMKLFRKDDKGVSTQAIIGLGISLLMTMIIMPIALNQIGGMNNENWGDNRDTLLVIVGTVIPIVVILGLAQRFLG